MQGKNKHNPPSPKDLNHNPLKALNLRVNTVARFDSRRLHCARSITHYKTKTCGRHKKQCAKMCAKKAIKNPPKGLYRRDGRWWGRLSHNGQQLRKPMTPEGYRYATTRMGVAQIIYRRWQEELGRSDDKVSFEEIVLEWERAIGLSGSKKQARANMSAVQEFIRFVNIVDLELITKRHLQQWVSHLDDKGFRPRTIRNKLSALSSLFNYCFEHEIIDTIPRIKPPKIPKLPPRFLSDKERAKALLLAKEYDCFLEVFVPLVTGVRLSELRRMDWEDFHWKQRILVLPITKSNRPRTIPLSQEAIKTLKPLAKKGPVYPGRQYAGCSGYRKEHSFFSKLDPIRQKMPEVFTEGMGPHEVGRAYHLFRHDFGVRAAKAGVPLTELKNWMGHVDIATTMIYAAYSPDKYSEHIEKVGI